MTSIHLTLKWNIVPLKTPYLKMPLPAGKANICEDKGNITDTYHKNVFASTA
jgi:hypothetical protein